MNGVNRFIIPLNLFSLDFLGYNITMKQEKIDFVKLLKGYESGWVGISSDFSRVLFSGKSLKEVKEKAKKAKDKIYFFPAGQSYSNFIG
jgi:hypothetical protein